MHISNVKISIFYNKKWNESWNTFVSLKHDFYDILKNNMISSYEYISFNLLITDT